MNRDEMNFLKKNRYYPFPKTIQIEITRRCPFRCSQCYKRKLEDVDMDYAYLMAILDTIEPCRQCRYKKTCGLCRAMNMGTSANYTTGLQKCINYFREMAGV